MDDHAYEGADGPVVNFVERFGVIPIQVAAFYCEFQPDLEISKISIAAVNAD